MRRRRSRKARASCRHMACVSQPMIRASGFALLVGLAACAPADPSFEDSESGTANDELVGAPPTALVLAQSLDTGGFRLSDVAMVPLDAERRPLAAAGAKLYAMELYPSPSPAFGWTYLGGRLVSSDSTLSIRIEGPARPGASLILGACERGDPDCRFVFRDNMFVSERDPSLSIFAPAGIRNSRLVLERDCTPRRIGCAFGRPPSTGAR